MTRSARRLVLLLALVSAAALRWPSLDLPFDRDEGEYATVAQQWAHGVEPYRDLLEQKPPLVPLLYRAAFALGGDTVASVRGLAMVWQLATVALVFLLMSRLAGDAAATAAAALYAVASCGTRIQGLTANTETFVTLPVLAAMLVVTSRHRGTSAGTPIRQPSTGRLGRFLLAGFLVGVASLAKQPAALAVVPIVVLGPSGLRDRARTGLAALLGLSLAWLVVLAYFWSRGAAGGAIYCLFSYNLAYGAQGAGGWVDRALGAGRAVLAEQGLVWLAAAAGAVRARRSGNVAALVSWLAAAVGFVAASGRFYPHYFVVTVAPLACLGGLLLQDREGTRLARNGGTRLAGSIVGAAAVLLAAAAVARTSWRTWAATSPGERSVRIFGIPHFALAGEVAEEVAKIDPGGRTLWIWGAEPELYALSHRRPANRFLFDYPFTGDAPPYPGGEEEVLASLTAPATRVAVVTDRIDATQAFGRKLAAALKGGFSPVFRRGPFVVFLRQHP